MTVHPSAEWVLDLEEEESDWESVQREVKECLEPFLESIDEFYLWDKEYIHLCLLPEQESVARHLHRLFQDVMTQARVYVQCFKFVDITFESFRLADHLLEFHTFLTHSIAPQFGKLKRVLYLTEEKNMSIHQKNLLFALSARILNQ